MIEILIAIGFLIATGLFAGVLSAVFGLGGGLVVVPILYQFFEKIVLADPDSMHLAVGTSLAAMFITSINSAYRHQLRGDVIWGIVYKLLPWLIVGVFIGLKASHDFTGLFVHHLFILLLIVLIMYQVLKKNFTATHSMADFKEPTAAHFLVIGLMVGFLAIVLGVGGSFLIVPFLRAAKMPMVNAASVAVALVPVVSILGSIGYLYAGMNQVGLPDHSFGYIYLPALAGITVGSLFGVPLGIKLSHVVSDNLLAKGYIAILLALLVLMVV